MGVEIKHGLRPPKGAKAIGLKDAKLLQLQMQMGSFRKLMPFGPPSSPFKPDTGRFEPLGSRRDRRNFTITSETDEYLVCTDEQGDTVNVAKPLEFRKSTYDGRTVNGVSYVYGAAWWRTASKAGEDDEVQKITPDYVNGETIMAFKTWTNLTDDNDDQILWEEAGTGRVWAHDPDGA